MLSQHIGRAENSAAADFNRLGFVVLRQAIPERAQSDLLIVVRDMIASRAEATGLTDRIGPAPTDVVEFFAHYLPAVDRLDHSIIKLAYDSCFDTIAGRCLFSNTEIIGMCAELLGCDPRRLYLNSNRLRIDPPGPAPFRLGWHHESAYGASRSPGVQYWGPLLWPSNWENGSIEIAVGSHRLGYITDLKVEQRAVGAQQYLVPEEILRRFPAELIEIGPGDVVVFSCHLVHRSSDPSRQTRMKYSVTGRFTDAASSLFSPYSA